MGSAVSFDAVVWKRRDITDCSMRRDDRKGQDMTILKARRKRQRGSAIITVLVVIFVLTMLGTVALIAGYSNVAMGSNYRQWSEDWFKADMNAERILKTADEAMRLAEKDAYAYFQNEWYAIDPSGTWNEADMRNLTVREQTHFHDQYALCPDPIEDTAGYQTFMTDFVNAGFPKIQQVYARHRLSEWIVASTEANLLDAFLVASPGSGFQELVAPVGGDPIPAWTAFDAEPDNLVLALRVMQEDAVKKTRQVLDIRVAVAPTVVENVVAETLQRSVRGNPVWANAMTAGGTIRVLDGMSVTISGDVASTAVDETSLSLHDNSELAVNGNLYAAGNVQMVGHGGTLELASHDQTDSFKNRMFGQNGHFFDVVSTLYDAGGIGQIVFDPTADVLDWFPNDTRGGTFLADNLLLVGDGNTAIIHGIAMTSDDVQIDGKDCHVSLLGGSDGADTSAAYVGIQSRGSEISSNSVDPNNSSSIINNYPDVGLGGGSSVTIDGGVVVPGIIHFAFKDKIDAAGASLTVGTAYYASAESVSGKSINMFNLYQVNPEEAEHKAGDPLDMYSHLLDFGDGTMVPYYLKDNTDGAGNVDTSALMAWITDPSQNPAISELSGSYDTGIHNDGSQTGYTLGFFVTDTDIFYGSASVVNVTPLNWFTKNRDAYEQKSTQLAAIFHARTQRLGVDRVAHADSDQISDFVGSGTGLSSTGPLMRYFDTDALVDVNATPSGILYCRGNLTLQGSGTFTGTIICEGDITIGGNIDIVQSDAMVYRTISGAPAVEDFFEPGTVFVEDTAAGECYMPVTVWSIGTMRVQKRYDVLEWRESYEFF